MPPIGFVVLTHARPDQAARLLHRLVRMYGDPPIVVHHDHDRCAVDASAWPASVQMVRPHVRTRWAHWSLVRAATAGIGAMFRRADAPEWCVLLSGADYPCAPAARVIGELMGSGADALMTSSPVPLRGAASRFERHLRRRYLRLWLRFGEGAGPLLSKQRLVIPAAVCRVVCPFNERFPLHYGSQWFSCNRAAAERIVGAPRTHAGLARFMRFTHIPDEAFIPSLLNNSPGLRIAGDNRRYTRWMPGSSHPEVLTLDDLGPMAASGAHFARKFDADGDPRVLDEVDAMVG